MFSPSMACLFSFWKQGNFLMLMKLNFHTFIFIEHMFVVLKKALPTLRFQWFFSHVTSKSFIVLGLKFSFVIHFNFYYVIKLKVQSVATIEKRVFSLLSCLVPVTLVRRPQWVSFQAIPLSTSVLPSSQHGQQPGSQTPSRLLIFMRRVPCISLLLFFF